MFMNEAEIDHAVYQIERHAPQLLPYAKYLSDWKDVINGNSDGWPHWQAGRKSADKLVDLVSKTVDCLREGRRDDLPMAKEFDKALTPIKAAATRHKLQAPVLSQVQEALTLEPAASTPSPYGVCEGWGHFFTDPATGKDREYSTRFVADMSTGKLVSAQVMWNANGDYEKATDDEIADLEDSVVNANDALSDPDAWEIELVDELPDWAEEAAPAPRI